MRGIRQNLVRYAVGVVAAVAAIFLRRALDPLLGSENPYHTAWAAVALSVWYGGVGPAVVTIAITLAGIWYWFLPPYRSFMVESKTELFGMLGFLAFSAVILLLGETAKRSIARREEAEDLLRKAHEELEERVRERAAAFEQNADALQQKTAELIEKAAMLDLANDAIFVRTASDKISYWNKGAERLYGWTREEILGRDPHDLLRTEFPEPLEVIKARESWEGELRHSRRDGSRIIVASHWTTLRDSAGKPTGWLEINTDITSRKTAEDSTRRLSARILNLQDEERRRIARELHDSLGQYLAALKMNLDGLALSGGEEGKIAAECAQIVAMPG